MDAMDTNAMDTNAMDTTHMPARFPITSNDANATLQHIYTVTKNCSGININYVMQMAENITKRKQTWFGTLEAPTDIIVIKQIIGKYGFHLKKFTSKYGVDLIWHDRVTNIFMVWGNKPCLIGALHALKRQVRRFLLKQTKDNEKLEQMASSMTSLYMESVDMTSAYMESVDMTSAYMESVDTSTAYMESVDTSTDITRRREEDGVDEPPCKRCKTNC